MEGQHSRPRMWRTTDCEKVNVPEPMSVNKRTKFDPTTEVLGTSLIGATTSISVPRYDISLDAGHSAELLHPNSNIFLSHTHTDHLLGMNDYFCMASKLNKPITIMAHPETIETVEKGLEGLKEKNPDVKFDVTFKPVRDGDVVKVNPDRKFKFFKVEHEPSSLGISVLERNNGEWKNKLTFTGDLEVDQHIDLPIPDLSETENLIIESSIIGGWRHIVGVEQLESYFNHTTIDDIDEYFKQHPPRPKRVMINHIIYNTCKGVEKDICSVLGDNGTYYFPNCTGKGTGYYDLVNPKPLQCDNLRDE